MTLARANLGKAIAVAAAALRCKNRRREMELDMKGLPGKNPNLQGPSHSLVSRFDSHKPSYICAIGRAFPYHPQEAPARRLDA